MTVKKWLSATHGQRCPAAVFRYRAPRKTGIVGRCRHGNRQPSRCWRHRWPARRGHNHGTVGIAWLVDRSDCTSLGDTPINGAVVVGHGCGWNGRAWRSSARRDSFSTKRATQQRVCSYDIIYSASGIKLFHWWNDCTGYECEARSKNE